ncbi:hypothetical protein BXY82_0686 [Gelidibacter sediminis]|uniref:Uncharacterized protein n=1 Tax=Gelidibacter sediminis TaxID=1608710 RepID=A0A4V3F979_9FLAO|nr:hypothetical protein [Gelidibacter sediminis]TDU43276.1 hypothetical protein BXY82_0686 [Gelidibacter sediminis]
MKYLIIVLVILTLGSIAAGFIFETEYSQKMIGFGTVGLFLVVFPLFTYHRWKDRNFKDYMLTKENLDKMRDKEKNKF